MTFTEIPLYNHGPWGRYSAAYTEPFPSKFPVVPSSEAAWLSKRSLSGMTADGKVTRDELAVRK